MVPKREPKRVPPFDSARLSPSGIYDEREATNDAPRGGHTHWSRLCGKETEAPLLQSLLKWAPALPKTKEDIGLVVLVDDATAVHLRAPPLLLASRGGGPSEP